MKTTQLAATMVRAFENVHGVQPGEIATPEQKELAQKCAKACVDYILNEVTGNKPRDKFYREVRKEIDNV
jgi:hypothetical protein